ncbi:MAG TPA: transglutaminase-like domain-containing protein [Acidimicrobiales bacterium]|nr:transglutaminase-like domain-containing protein [Acidimicrobiales bacterium]
MQPLSGATERFAELVRRPEAEIPLDEAALLIAAHAYPGLDVAAQQRRIDDLADGCPEPTVESLRRHLFDELRFGGDARHYRDPRSSFLNDVMDRRAGIPISLSVLTMEVGRRLGLALVGVGMPGHFLVRHQDGGEILDPFGGGRTLDADDCGRLFRNVHGPGPAFGPRMLATAGRRAILVRMLANLRLVYLAAGDAPASGWVDRLRATVPAETAADRADVARALASLGRFVEAADVLDDLAESVPAPGADRARSRAASLRARLN